MKKIFLLILMAFFLSLFLLVGAIANGNDNGQGNGQDNEVEGCETEQDCIDSGECDVGLECTCCNGECNVGLVAGPCNGDNGDDEDELCANYTSDGVETEYCAACGDGICEDIERCVSSSCSNNTCTSDCGPLYCIEDCEDEDGNGAGRNKTKVEFFPWQKRNESECLEGCECHGAVQSCETEDGKTMTIEAGRSGNIITITVEKNGNRSECNTSLEMEQERDREKNETRLYTYLSNGRKAEVKIMPDAASEKAIERLGELNFTVELKEIGKGEEVQLAYELKAGKEGKILGLFRKQAQLGIEVSAENGEVIRVRRPWWAFLATGV